MNSHLFQNKFIKTSRFLFCFLIVFSSTQIVFSEENHDYRILAETILIAESELRKEIYSDNFEVIDSHDFINIVMKKECEGFNLNRLNQELNEQKAEIARDDIGVKFEAGYRINNDKLEGDSHSGYAGLAWNLLDNGLLGNRSKAKRYSLENTLDSLKAENIDRQELYRCRITFLYNYFSYLKHTLLEERFNILERYYAQIRQLYFSGNIGAEELLKVELDLNRVKLLLDNYELNGGISSYNTEFRNYPLPGVFAVNYKELLSQYEEFTTTNQNEVYSESLLKEKYSLFDDKTLRLYARTGLSKEENEDTSNNVTVGVYFSTPINRKTRNLYPLELKRTKYRLIKEKNRVGNEVKRLSNSYTEKLGEAVRKFYDIRITAENLRKAVIELEKVLSYTGFYDNKQKLLIFKLLNKLYESRFNYLQLQENLYRRIVYMFSLTGTKWNARYTKATKSKTDLKRGRRGSRGIYIWTKDFHTYDNTFLIRVFAAKRISSVIISASDKTDLNKLANFISKAKSYNISTQLMISENSWVKPEKWHRVEKKLAGILAYSENVHLDIEPHVIDDYKSNKETYNNQFLSMIKKINQYMNDKGKLFISLPVKHTTEFIETVNNYADKIYIMAYGTRKIETMTRRLKPFNTISPENIVLALRPKDFQTELQLEKFIDQVAQQQNITAFAFHDLRQFFDLSGTLKLLNTSGGPKR